MRLIDADALKQTIGSYNPIKYTYEYGDVITVADIDNAPTIEAEPIKTGKWIGVGPMVDSMQCSECGYQIQSEELETPYCPNCGARMEAAKE